MVGRSESNRETVPDEGRDWTYAWLFELVDVDDQTKTRTKTVCMYKTAMASEAIAAVSSQAYGSMGRSSANAVLDESEPPSLLIITSGGVVPETIRHRVNDPCAAALTGQRPER